MKEEDLFPGFAERCFETKGATLRARVAGIGPGLVLLHGYPQTHVAWHKVAPALARRFSVAAIDLRGSGGSTCPPTDAEHRTYSKRTMAADVRACAAGLGWDRLSVVGHDRGGRVAYRLALDHPHLVDRLVVIDILPTPDHWRLQQADTRLRLFHWALLAQPAPIPEALVGADPSGWLEARFRRGTRSGGLDAFAPAALAAYRASLSDPDRLHATCEDFRAGAGIDLAEDSADLAAGRRIEAPTLALVASHGSLATVPDVAGIWRSWCRSVEVRRIESGHFVPEEAPEALLGAVLPFLTGDPRSP